MENEITFLSVYCDLLQSEIIICGQSYKFTIPDEYAETAKLTQKFLQRLDRANGAGFAENAQLIQKDFPPFISEETIYSKYQINSKETTIQNAYSEIRIAFIKGVFLI